MVAAREVFKKFPIRPATFYRLVKLGVIPAHEVTQNWHTRRQYRFLLSEVEAALARRHPDPA